MRAPAQALRLAALDFVHEWRVSACLVLALAAVATPMLVLFGMKFGLIEAMRGRLLEDPRTLEIRPLGSGHFPPAWFEAMAARPDVRFVVPRTRSIANTVTLINPNGPRGAFETVELVPTAEGDPLLGALAAGPGEAVLSGAAARALGLGPGDRALARIGRVRDGAREGAEAPLRVSGVLAEGRALRAVAFVPAALLDRVERFRDGFAVAEFAAEGPPAPQGERVYASFRLYARALDDIPRLRDLLEAEGHDIRTRADEIELVQAMDRNLSIAFWILAGIAVAGLTLSLAASLWANVERKVGALATLRLIGYPSGPLVLIPVAQALMVAAAGMALAGALYLAIAGGLNARFADSLGAGEVVCRLMPRHFLAGVAATMLLSLAASGLAGLRAASVEPGERLRDV